MNRTKILLTAIAVLAFGAFAPGCASAPDESLGSLCAKAEPGEKHCVRANLGPDGPWKDALAGGGLPIQMWATPPDAMTLDELVSSADNLKAWYADIDTVLGYVRDTQQNAESYHASMGGFPGVLSGLLHQAKDRQAEMLTQQPVDAVANFKAALSDKATTEANASPIVAAIAADKQSMAAVQAVFDLAKTKAAALSSSYADVASQFSAYRATEAAETKGYATLALQASQSTLDTLPIVEQAILSAGQGASAKPNALLLAGMKLAAQIQVFQVDPELAFTAEQADFLATHGAVQPDMTSSALRSLNAMLGYIQHRVTRSDAIAASLLNGVAAREQALLLLDTGTSSAKSNGSPPLMNVTEGSRDQIAKALLQKASTMFAASATERVAAIASALPTSATLKLPYVAHRYDMLTTLVQLEPLCDPSSSSWREAGCVALRKSFPAAKAARTTEIPGLITAGILGMRQKNIDPALLDAAQAKLDAGNIKAAAILHDAALRGTEGT
jgi:hypothetical protein